MLDDLQHMLFEDCPDHETLDKEHGRIERERHVLKTGETSTAVSYALIRNHWHIENRLHYVRDLLLAPPVRRARLTRRSSPAVSALANQPVDDARAPRGKPSGPRPATALDVEADINLTETASIRTKNVPEGKHMGRGGISALRYKWCDVFRRDIASVEARIDPVSS